jgi:alpha-D-xyloside xylohydrolase
MFLTGGCQSGNLVTLRTKGENGFAQFTVHAENLTTPFRLTGRNGLSGAVFFETSGDKTWLNGKPSEAENTEDSFKGTWNLENRVVTISMIRDSGRIRFSFKARPDAGILKWGMNIGAARDEYFTGLYERAVDGDQRESWKAGIKEAMDLNGQAVDMIIKPTLSLYCPFYLSSSGYGLFVEGTWPGHYDFCKTDPGLVSVEFEGPDMSGILYTAKNPADIVKAHSLHVGPTIVPPEWAFLPWRWRDNHSNKPVYYDGTKVNAPYNSMLVEDILMMKAFDIPCGVYWVDRPWARGVHGYADFEWDTERFPNPEKMIQWLHADNKKFLLWIAPWVAGNMRLEANRKGYSQPINGPHGQIDSTNVAEIDFTNPDACRWWQEEGLEKMLRQGVNGFKMDRSEELVPETRKITVHDGRTMREIRNDYPVMYVKTANEICHKVCGDDFMLIPRAGYSGSSKFSGFWGGDIGVPAEGLRTAIIALQRCAINGFPIWGSDIGGYWQGTFDREVCARWLAFGCFSPIMEFGPTDDRAPWDMASEPHYDAELIAIWRMYAKIHTALAEYSHNLAQDANKTGMPIARPLFLLFPGQKEAWTNWQTYMYGNDILVSGIWQKGTSSFTCYLPKGEEWRDAWNPEIVYKGGRTIEIKTPLYKIPVFIRKNSALNLGNLEELYRQSLKIAEQKPDLQKLEQTMFQ